MSTGVVDEFEAQRGRLFGIAYRMLGSANEAEDIVQDAWLRWQGADRSAVANPTAYLARSVTNLCLTELGSARARREVYVGPWLPEPVLTGDAVAGPLDIAERREQVSFALLTLMERLSPQERAAYVLREAFQYSHREIAELTGITEANARQVHSRAKARLDSAAVKPVDTAKWLQLVERFLGAAVGGDIEALESMLALDVVSESDGGGIVNAARNPILGRSNVARYTAGVMERFAEGLTPHFVELNGELALVGMHADGMRGAWFIETDGEQITALRLVLNPEKLRFAAAQLSQIGGPSGLSF